MNYKKVFVLKDNISIHKTKIKITQFDKFKLLDYSRFEVKLDKDFYFRYFIYLFLFEIDELELEDFLNFHYLESANSDLLLKILDLKITPQIKEIIDNALPNMGVAGKPLGIHIGDGFYETEERIYKYRYGIHKMCSLIGGKNFSAKYLVRLDLLKGFINRNKNSNKLTKLKWNSGPSELGVIMSELVSKGYIEAPYFNAEINYSKLAIELLEIFSMKKGKSSPKSLAIYLNPESERNQDKLRKFKELEFCIPDSKYV